MVIRISNLLINKYKGKYTLKCEYDQEKIEFNRKFNGTYEDVDVYVQCANKCKIFYYGNRGTLQFYCPSVPRGKNIIREIYGRFIDPENTETTKNELDLIKNGQTVHTVRTYYKPVDKDLFQSELASGDHIIFDVELTDEEVLFKFKYRNMDVLEDILKPSTISCKRSPFSNKNLPKSDYVIPDEDLEDYMRIIRNIPKEDLIQLVHISNRFIDSMAKNKKQVDALKEEKKRLRMKPKEFIHYKDKWDEYLTYIKEELDNGNNID